MAEFNYKKWVTENKYGIQPTMDGVDDSGGMMNEVMAPCDNASGNNLGCETFKECGSTTSKAYHFAVGNGSFSNTDFYNWAQQPALGEVIEIEDSNGVLMLLEYTECYSFYL